MGIRVYLALVEERVSDAKWREVYEKARRVAKEWIPRPLSLAWRGIGSVQVGQYCLDVETPEGLHVVGDAESLTTAESFVLPASLDGAARSERVSPRVVEGDVLVEVARWLGTGKEGGVSWRELFGGKTQGLPYHGLVVGLGLLVEQELPGAAVAATARGPTSRPQSSIVPAGRSAGTGAASTTISPDWIRSSAIPSHPSCRSRPQRGPR
jgi:hypothetical protein